MQRTPRKLCVFFAPLREKFFSVWLTFLKMFCFWRALFTKQVVAPCSSVAVFAMR